MPLQDEPIRVGERSALKTLPQPAPAQKFSTLITKEEDIPI